MTKSILGIDPERLRAARLYDLAHDLEKGIPVSPAQPNFQMALYRRHCDDLMPSGFSTASEFLATGTHFGTHVDALCHASHRGLLYGGIPVRDVESHLGFSRLGAETIPPMFRRGVMLDVAGCLGLAHLERDYEITAEDLQRTLDLQGTTIGEGDVVLVRTGWSLHWNDPVRFLGHVVGAPGPGVEAAQWLAGHRPAAVGGETVAFEVIHPGRGPRELPVHRVLLVEAGIYIMEMLDLAALAADGVREFLFVLAPLKLRGATGSPVRPLAVVDGP
jgi:kynurenine formamidase